MQLAAPMLALLMLPFAIWWRGFALSMLWQWFAVSTFGAAPLSVAQCIGLSIVAGAFTHQFQPTQKTEEDRKAFVLSWVIDPAVYLLIGYVVRQFL
jgi:hypothetical protein